jgi:hypothetical protein
VDATLKQAWIEALERGNYSKGKGSLHTVKDGVHYWCCLGVLCDLVAPEKWTYREGVMAAEHDECGYAMLSDSVREHVFGASINGEPYYHEHEEALAKLNDQSDTFAPAITYIKEYL